MTKVAQKKGFSKPSSREELKEIIYRRRYVVPNLVTVGNMFCGFLAIMYGSSGRYKQAVFSIFLAIILDGLDGRVARRLNATSRFGVEFDSFSDLVSFGVAPAVLIYHWAFQHGADEFGVFVTFIYVLCATSRLARFNISTENLSGFEGLPSPAAAGAMAALINVSPVVESDFWLRTLATAFVFLIAYLMVCTIPYRSIKNMKLKKIKPSARIFFGIMMALLWYRPKEGLLLLIGAYILSGPILSYKDRLITRKDSRV